MYVSLKIKSPPPGISPGRHEASVQAFVWLRSVESRKNREFQDQAQGTLADGRSTQALFHSLSATSWFVRAEGCPTGLGWPSRFIVARLGLLLVHA